MKRIVCVLCLWIGIIAGVEAQVRRLDDFENKNGWSFIRSDGVDLSLSNETGHTGNAARFDYHFTKGTGYGGIQKGLPINLPENYEFTFWIKADSPANNFEIKFIDSTGNNVWWVNNRNYTFPGEWTKIRIKKRHIHFAWGPTDDQQLKRIDRIEFTIASFVGGKGTIWIDDLKFEPLPPENDNYPVPLIAASSLLKDQSPFSIIDPSPETYWLSSGTDKQWLKFDFTTQRELGGLLIFWKKAFSARTFEILLSEDDRNWDKVYSVSSNYGDRSFIRLPEIEAKYLKINFIQSNNSEGYGVSDIKFLTVKESLTPNDFFMVGAKNSPVGDYPRYFSDQASYWTVTGVNNDVKEALINEDGMVEVDKACFSLEPVIRIQDSLYTWNKVKSQQSLGATNAARELDFIPTVTWQCGDVSFKVAAATAGEANKSSRLVIEYSFENKASGPEDIEFYLLIRPFQVNPFYQFLNLSGGAGRLHSLREAGNDRLEADEKTILTTRKYDDFCALHFDDGNPVELISKSALPSTKAVMDAAGYASGVMKYKLHLNPGENISFFVVVPFYRLPAEDAITPQAVQKNVQEVRAFWKEKTGHVQFHLPSSADRILAAYRSNLAYILVNRDKTGIQPGSRSYERSWIRDGALTSSALLKSGIVEEVRDFIRWYASHQYENGKVPCVVDFRGPDPVPENDSHGELIYLIREYFNFTNDTAFLRSMNVHVLQAVKYIESLIAERSTDHFKYGNDSIRAYYGLVPESISHEGYSAKPMHSYWDNFFIMKGLKDAAEIQKILGEKASFDHCCRVRDEFQKNLYHSLDLAIRLRKIDYIPGCVELGDFDATSTTIALTPCNELNHLPKPQVYNTFDKYYTFFCQRRDGLQDWVNYTPYENRLIGSFILLDQPERAHALTEYFLDDQLPQGWHHWAEVVWHDHRTAKYIGDMPHTWVGSDFINAFRNMFVYENEYDASLVLGAALYQDWIDSPSGMSVENLPTYYGDISFAIKKDQDSYLFSITGDVRLPVNGIKIRNFNGAKQPVRVTINGRESRQFTHKEIQVTEIPAEVRIYY